MEDAYGGSWGDNIERPIRGFNEGDIPISECEDEEPVIKPIWEDNFNTNNRPKHSNAYMLVYINADECESIMKDITEDDIPEHLSQRFQREDRKADRMKKYKEEEDEHFRIRLVDEETVRNVDGTMLTFCHDFLPTGLGFTSFNSSPRDQFRPYGNISQISSNHSNLYATQNCPKK